MKKNIKELETTSNTTHTNKKALTTVLEAIHHIHLNKNKTKQYFIETGFGNLDYILNGGLPKGSLTILAGDARMEKTNLICNLAKNIACLQKQEFGIISLKNSTKNITTRIISTTGELNIIDINKLHLSKKDWDKITMAFSSIAESPLFINDQPFSTTKKLLKRIETIIKNNNLKILAIDDFPFRYCDKKDHKKTAEMFTYKLQKLARKTNTIIILTAGINHAADRRKNSRPKLSDLKINGDITSTSDIVLLLYRYENLDDEEYNQEILEIMIAKNSLHGTGRVILATEPHKCMIKNPYAIQ